MSEGPEDPKPNILRSALVAALERHRDNDVVVCVPLEGRDGALYLTIHEVRYDKVRDVVEIVTEPRVD